MSHQIVSNQAEFIEHSVANVLPAAIFGGILAVIILFVFLRDLRSTLTIGFSIPVSIMATFALMYQTDISLNIMSLGAVALGVGMLVDNSIVVLVSIYQKLERGTTRTVAACRGTQEVITAVVAATLTSVIIFVPLVFGQETNLTIFLGYTGVAIVITLSCSLFISLTLIPMGAGDPILMTALTTVVGLIPLAVGTSTLLDLRYFPMARTLMGGLMASTVLTLAVLPTYYTLMDDLAEALKRVWRASSARVPSSSPAVEPVADRRAAGPVSGGRLLF